MKYPPSQDVSKDVVALPSQWVTNCIRLLAVTALGVAAFLAWSAYQVGDIAGCSGGGIWDCGHVLHSKWSKWMTIPVSIPAAVVYASMLMALLFAGPKSPASVRKAAWAIVSTLAFAAALSAIWFIYLQVFEIEHLCKWCLMTHSCGLLIASLILIKRPFGWTSTVGMGSLALMGVSVLVLGQVYGKEPATFAIDVHSAPAPDSVAVLESASEMEFGSPLDEFSAPSDDFMEQGEFASPLDDLDPDVEAAVEKIHPVSTQPVRTTPVHASPEDPDDLVSDPTRSMRRISPALPLTAGVPDPASAVSDAPVTVTATPNLAPVPALTPVVPPTSGPPRAATPVPTLAPLPEEAKASSAVYEEPVADKSEADKKKSGQTNKDQAGKASDAKVRPVAGETQAAPKKRLVYYPGAEINLNVANWPILGSNTAPHIVVELFDYTCPYCRVMHQHMNVARQRFGDEIAFIVMPVPLSRECNPTVQSTSPEHAEACEIARLALGVWRCDASQFPKYHHWLLSADRARTAHEARRHAESLVSPDRLQRVLAGTLLPRFLNQHVELYRRSGEGTLPKLLTERVTVRGRMDSADTLCRTLQENLNIQNQ